MTYLNHITPDQFEALAKLLRIRHGASRTAASLVLVSGHTLSDAAKLTGLTASGAGKVVRRFRAGLNLAIKAGPASVIEVAACAT